MKSTERFTPEGGLAGRLRLRFGGAAGEDRQVEIAGVVLEGQLELDSGEFLLLSTDDCPFEETLHITLVDAQGAVLELLDIGEPMQPGLFGRLTPVAGRAAEFDFFPKRRHRLEVRDANRGLFSGVYRKRRLRHTHLRNAGTDDNQT